MKNRKRILNVTVYKTADYDGDASWLGEFSDDPRRCYKCGKAIRGEFMIHDDGGFSHVNACPQ